MTAFRLGVALMVQEVVGNAREDCVDAVEPVAVFGLH